MVQVNKEHYNPSRYNHQERWNSYWYQLKLILNEKPSNVLEVGVGSGVIGRELTESQIQYETVDLAIDLNPTYKGDIVNFKIDKKYDVVVAFQVLEHIPYDKFKSAIINLLKHTNQKVIISLPYFGPYIRFKLDLYPLLKINYLKKIYYPKKLIHDEHEWEIGRPGYPLKKIKNDISEIANIVSEQILYQNPYHYFFVLEKK